VGTVGHHCRQTWRIALCGAFNRFTDILQCDVEPGVPLRDAAEWRG
jgi:hypothetical protein